MNNFHSESIDRLFRSMVNLKSVEDCYKYFEDLCTVKEIQDMAQRLETAIMLDCGENYQTISEKVGISTATIGRVSKCLKYGSGGYRDAIDKLRSEDTENDN
ncbi:MAG: TrpR-related protein YerC/YecD [Clostridia bacterium]|nr:TrpR-related protein YerC/YecD [Clostridia bacterium]